MQKIDNSITYSYLPPLPRPFLPLSLFEVEQRCWSLSVLSSPWQRFRPRDPWWNSRLPSANSDERAVHHNILVPICAILATLSKVQRGSHDVHYDSPHCRQQCSTIHSSCMFLDLVHPRDNARRWSGRHMDEGYRRRNWRRGSRWEALDQRWRRWRSWRIRWQGYWGCAKKWGFEFGQK